MMPMHYNGGIMSEPTPPALMRHHGYRSWTSAWWDDQGHKRMKRFGKEGEVSPKEADRRFKHWLRTEWEACPQVRNPDDPTTYTVALLAAAYKEVARATYTKRGQPTTHVDQIVWAMDALAEAYGDKPAAALTNPLIAKLRDKMIVGKAGEPLTVKTVNGRLFAIKQAIKWAREKDLVTAETLADVLAVTPLRQGRCKARPSRTVGPVDETIVERTLEHCSPTVAAMARVQELAGMRPGEVCLMRRCDIDMSREVWIYAPHEHKLEHKAIDRRIPLGPSAQAILAPFLKGRRIDEYLFSPAESAAEHRARRTKDRTTPLSCGNTVGSNRKHGRKKRAPGEVFTVGSYRNAIRRACAAAECPLWHPNQLRHNYATRTRERFGYEHASDGLGHRAMNTTAIYAELSMQRSIEVAKAAG